MHAIEWINEHGRYRRHVYADDLRRFLKREKGTCTWCGGILGGRRRSWCSEDCVEAFRSRCDVSHIRYLVKQRDKGVCAACGLDTEALVDRIKKLLDRSKESRRCHSWRRLLRIKRQWCANSYSAWEADHILPVIEGGGCCGIDGYRTLCRRCHKKETRELAGRRAANRRPILRALESQNTFAKEAP